MLNIDPSLVLHEDADGHRRSRHPRGPAPRLVERQHRARHSRSSARPARRSAPTVTTSIRPSSTSTPASCSSASKPAYLAISSALTVKWMLEHRSESPGIDDGDVFLTNDPWIGSTHQPDVDPRRTGVRRRSAVLLGGEHPASVGHRRHRARRLQPDGRGRLLGGAVHPAREGRRAAASCAATSRSSTCATRACRELVDLDLRAEITGCHVAATGSCGSSHRYGADTVKATMRRVQDDSEAAFVRRLETIPDGTWTEEGWLEVKEPGDRGLYRNRVTLTKQGDRLIFSNARLGAAGGHSERHLRGLERRGRGDARTHDAVRPDALHRGRAAPLRVRRRARD